MAIYDTPAAAMAKLHEIGVPLEPLQRAIAAGHVHRISCTENHAPFFPGTTAWAYTLSSLRDDLLRLGWRKADPANFSLIINDKRKIQIVVESGDDGTRLRHLSPRTKSLKGLYLEATTLRNRLKDDLFPETLEKPLQRAIKILEYPTWILLIHITDEEYRAELSLPDALKDGHVTGWSDRIFIPDSDDPFGAKTAPGEEDSGPDVDVPVRRKL
jgi:hypothetical protein